ncbi:hypothetical protein EV714DRAFT_273610 [Schizophyllum commune]
MPLRPGFSMTPSTSLRKFHDALQVHQCIVGCAQFDGSRAAKAFTLVNASMPRKSINATASSPIDAEVGQLNDFSDIAFWKTQHPKPSR